MTEQQNTPPADDAVKAAKEQERADMEAIGRSFMATLAIVIADYPDWKDWAPAEDPVELVGDLLDKIDELKVEHEDAVPPELPEGTRTTPLEWDELAPFSIEGTIALAAWVLEGADQGYIMKCEPGHQYSAENWFVFNGASDGHHNTIIQYAIERRPAPEVLFNKMRELGGIDGGFEDLKPFQRAGFELAARIIPAVADVAETINAQLAAKFPPPAPLYVGELVDEEDSILEQLSGIGDIDPDRAAAQAGADRAAADDEAKAAKPKRARRKRSIDAAAAE